MDLCAHDLSLALPPFLQLELTAKRHSEIEVFVCWSEFGTLPRQTGPSLGPQPHTGVALGVVGIRDSEWARQVNPAGRFPGDNVRVANASGCQKIGPD